MSDHWGEFVGLSGEMSISMLSGTDSTRDQVLGIRM
jgi:hypothetical protein